MNDAKILIILLISALLMTISAPAYSSNVDIDYVHNIEGTGTVITDYKMGSDESTVAVGKVRGTGEVTNKYLYQSNNTENVTIEDQFHLSGVQESHPITIGDYPQMTRIPGSFRLLGTAWAGRINITGLNSST
jgi:hypothetical protein